MYSIRKSKFCYVTTVLKQKLLTKYQTILFPIFFSKTHGIDLSIIMESKYFKGHHDHYNGITIDSIEESCAPSEFAERLTASLNHWTKSKTRVAWFRIYLLHSTLIPTLVKEGFKFHHAREEYVMLYRWLATNEKANVPHYAHTNLGIGGFVYNENTNEILVVKEKYSHKTALWKLPGGYVEPGENLEDAAIREVLEETGVHTSFKSILSFRHTHDHAFACSDMYIVAYLCPLSSDITKCNREIADCKWMKVDEYLEHSHVHENNKTYAKKMLEFVKHRMGITVEHAIHPTLNKPLCVYSISKVDSM